MLYATWIAAESGEMLGPMDLSKGTKQALGFFAVIVGALWCTNRANDGARTSAVKTAPAPVAAAPAPKTVPTPPAKPLEWEQLKGDGSGSTSYGAAWAAAAAAKRTPAEIAADERRERAEKAKAEREEREAAARQEAEDLAKARAKFAEMLNISMTSRGLEARILTEGKDETTLVFRGMGDCDGTALREYTRTELFTTLGPSLKFKRFVCEDSGGRVTASITLR